MHWNWTLSEWPNFISRASELDSLERRFLLASGEVLGAVRHVGQGDRDRLQIELLSEEALRTSAIEGEILDRLSVQSSLRRHFGLAPDTYPEMPREQGVSAMMVDVYASFQAPLDHQTLFNWHHMLLAHDSGLEVVGGYRSHSNTMQIVSGSAGRPTVHFEAPPSARVPDEMKALVIWFNRT
ncbi:MAG: cell filamentation protein Fic, partial [Rhodobacterales bacterium 17-64-5]